MYYHFLTVILFVLVGGQVFFTMTSAQEMLYNACIASFAVGALTMAAVDSLSCKRLGK